MIVQNKNSKPPYLIGLLGVIPLVGFFVGIALLLYGIIKYKDKKLIFIGVSCILFTIIFYSSLFYFGFRSDKGREGWAQLSQIQLNSLVKNVEFYKIEKGYYPDSLEQLLNKDEIISISDPLILALNKKESKYNYKKLGNKYLLFSSGIDGKANTKDDLYPKIDTHNKEFGWIKYERK